LSTPGGIKLTEQCYQGVRQRLGRQRGVDSLQLAAELMLDRPG
jgi:hypothetical protein